jgi:hypothetical protein
MLVLKVSWCGIGEDFGLGSFLQSDEVALAMGRGARATCRGAWARVNVDQFRHLALQTCYTTDRVCRVPLSAGVRPSARPA